MSLHLRTHSTLRRVARSRNYAKEIDQLPSETVHDHPLKIGSVIVSRKQFNLKYYHFNLYPTLQTPLTPHPPTTTTTTWTLFIHSQSLRFPCCS